ncbi:MAG: hypothetical protein ACE5M4_08830 [Anaerolineales bacterium]
MALLPSFTLIFGTLAIIMLRGRRSQTVSLISAGLTVAAAVLLSQRLPAETTIALWRPIELFGPGFIFSIDTGVWPFVLLASAVVLAEALFDGRSMARLLYAGLALAAIAGGNLLNIAMLWTLMISMETALRLTGSGEIGAALRKSGAQFVAVAAAMVAAYLGEGAAVFLAVAALIRSFGGSEARFPFSLAILAPLGAYTMASRYSPKSSALLWIAGAMVAFALIQSLFSKSRLTVFALALAGAGLLAPQAAQSVAWVSVAAVLIATVGLHHAGGSRIAWGAVAAVPFAFFVTPLEPELLVIATLLTAALAAISRLQPRSSNNQSPSRVEVGSIAMLIAASVLALLGSGWLPSLGGALTAGLGLAAGYAIGRAHPVLSKVQLPTRRTVEVAQRVVRAVSGSLAAAIRTTAEVLEGESAVLWILLVLLIAIIGLQAVAV